MRVVAFGFALVAGFAGLRFADEWEKKRALSHMAGRPALPDKEFSQQYFSSDRTEIASKLRKILSKHIPVDLSRMHPTDRFIEDLRMDALDSLSTVEYVLEIEKEFAIEIPNSAAANMAIFQNVVDYVADAVKAKAH
jgi:acyl carrier protein